MQLDAKLRIIFEVKAEAVIDGEKVGERYLSNIQVELGKKTVELAGDLESEKLGYITKDISIQKNMNVAILVVDVIVFIISLYILSYVNKKTTVAKSIKNEYKIELNKILRTCEDKIVQVSGKMDVDGQEVVEVRDFGELIKLSEEVSKPILCWINRTIDEAWFTVISSNVTYRYILKGK